MREAFIVDVHEMDVMVACGENLGYTVTHKAGTDDRDLLDPVHVHNRFFPYQLAMFPPST
jgi:hypothetical protein